MTAASALAMSGVAVADQIANNLDATVDTVAETMSLNVGGDPKTTQLRVITTDGDGKSGCNFQGHETITVDVLSSSNSIATVSPSSLTFGSCDDVKTLTVTPVAEGSSSITLSQTGNSTGDTFDYRPASFTAVVAAPSNTAPSISVDGVDHGATYNKGNVPGATCSVTDAEDGPSSFAATLSAIAGTYASDGIGQQTASCSYTDGGGLPVASSKTYNIIDPSAPSIDYTLSPATANGQDGWYTGNVTLTWSVTDADSPNSLQKTGCVDQSITTDQASTSYSCSATSAGGPAGPVTVSIRRDATAPSSSATGSTVGGGYTSGNWTNEDVTLTLTGQDGSVGSGVKEILYTTDGSTPSATVGTVYDAASKPRVSTDGVHTVKFVAVDNAGNVESPMNSFVVKLDKTAPQITDVTSALTPDGSNGWFKNALSVTFRASDGLSGFDGKLDPHTFPVSSGAVEGSAVRVSSGTVNDVAGNTGGPATSAPYKIDLSDPELNITGAAHGSSFNVCSAPARPTFVPTDAISGIDATKTTSTWTPPSTGSGVGTYTYTATATDVAGRSESQTRTYSAEYGTAFTGVQQPINGGTTTDLADDNSRFKLGSTVPVKFRLLCGSAPISNAVARLNVKLSDNNPDPGTEEATSTAASTTGNLFRYDSMTGQYIFNLNTKTGYTFANPDGTTTVTPFGQGTYRLSILLDDGSHRSFNVHLVK